jgi:prepilin-type processing-associated H-X9-DG protein
VSTVDPRFADCPWHFNLYGAENVPYSNALVNVSFVDGHASFIRCFYDPNDGKAPMACPTVEIPACRNDQSAPD